MLGGDEDGARLGEEAVQRHREASVGPRAEPLGRHLLELRPLGGPDFFRAEQAGRVTRASEPVDRLPDLANRPALERELAWADDRLLADLERAQAGGAVHGQQLGARARDSDAPATRPRGAREVGQQVGELIAVTDGISADESRSGHNAEGEEGTAAGREEVALVLPQSEEVEASAAVALDERASEVMLFLRLRDAVTQRKVEPAPEQQEVNEQHACRQAHFRVEPLREVGGADRDDEQRGYSPRAPAPARERGRDPEEGGAEDEGDDARTLGHSGQQEARDEVGALGQLRVEAGQDREDPDRKRGRGQEPLGREPFQPDRDGLRVARRAANLRGVLG